ncbi:cytochrome P450 [Boletus edulis]|nr:cytochrome P450 [Boletus edulis]
MDHLDSALYAIAVVGVFLTICFIGLVVKKKLTPHQLPLPPGPKGLPFIGNALQINKTEPWLTYKEWTQTYGEIVSCKLLGQTYIIINSERVAKALLDQRSSIYSDRPVIKTSEAFGLEFNTGHQAYGDTWKAHRKIVQQCFNSSIIPKYHAAVTEKARALMLNLLHSPERFESHMGMFSASIIMAITYGYNVIEKDDPFVGPIEEMVKIAINMTPERAVLLELFPHILKFPIPSWFPGAWLQRLARRSKELSPKIRDIPFQFVKECLAKGIENDSMVAQCLNDEDKNAAGQDRVSYGQIIKDAATSCFLATLNTLILAMIMYPEVQDRAQALLDKVVGRDRLPTLNDRASLQYIDAMLREALRWGSLVPMCVPHRVTQDDVFERSLIPKGAVIIPNLWGMARDEEVYPDPTTFNPDRYLDANGNIITDELSGVYFGYGRRVCPGRYLAHTSTWLAGANMLLLFRFSKAIGPAGYEIDVFHKFTGGVACRPVSFPCRITPRFEGIKDLLE